MLLNVKTCNGADVALKSRRFDVCRGMTKLNAAVSALNEEESREDAR